MLANLMPKPVQHLARAPARDAEPHALRDFRIGMRRDAMFAPFRPAIVVSGTDSLDGGDGNGAGRGLADPVPAPVVNASASDAGVAAPPVSAAPPVTAAPPPATAPPDVISSADPPTKALSVTFATVDAATTPAGVTARIPPREKQSVAVTISSPRAVDITVDGASATNGTATVNGATSTTLTSGGTIDLVGIIQTAKGAAGMLTLAARAGGKLIGTSNPFTICAIPIAVEVDLDSLGTGSERGIRVRTQVHSDSRVLGDLDLVEMAERIEHVNITGCFLNARHGRSSGFRPASASPYGFDKHYSPVTTLTSPGTMDVRQVFIFNDARSQAASVPVKQSGHNIHRSAADGGMVYDPVSKKSALDKRLWFTVTETAVATSALGFSADAGIGDVPGTPQLV